MFDPRFLDEYLSISLSDVPHNRPATIIELLYLLQDHAHMTADFCESCDDTDERPVLVYEASTFAPCVICHRCDYVHPAYFAALN